jgi:Hint domain
MTVVNSLYVSAYSGSFYLRPSADPLIVTDTGQIQGNSGSFGYCGVFAFDIGQINNAGEIAAGNATAAAQSGIYGIGLFAGGQITNSGSIFGGGSQSATGGDAIYLAGSTTITNDGTIAAGRGATGGIGIDFNVGTGSLTNAAGAIIDGGLGGSAGGGDGGAGVVLNAGGSIRDSGLIQGGQSLSASSEAGGNGVDLSNGGVLHVYSTGVVAGGHVNRGTGGDGVFLNGGTLITDGTIDGGSAHLGTAGAAVQFGASDASMIVSGGAYFGGVIAGFHYGDSIDLENLSPTVVASEFNPTTDTISSVYDGTLQFTGNPDLVFSSDGHGGTLVTVACFRRGTRITAEHGERAVESLEIGDRVMTLAGGLKRIRWVGKRHYTAEALAERPEVRPVLVRAGALDDFLPRRDLWVSPEHALYVKGALVPAGLLTNGVSILTDESVSSVSYYHLEFESHEVVFAEGAPAESFVDDDSRQMFDNAAEYALRYPDAPRTSASFCAPRIEDGEPLQTLRMQLAARTGLGPQPSHEAAVATRAA